MAEDIILFDDTSEVIAGIPGTLLLIIEDDPSLRELLRDVLKLSGFRVEAAADGQTCLNLAKTLQPDCILLDLRLPDIDGFAVLRRLRNDPTTAAIPVIVLSGFTRIEDQELALELGAVAYITKPYNIPDLILVVRSVIEKSYRS